MASNGNFDRRLDDLDAALHGQAVEEREAFRPSGVGILRMVEVPHWRAVGADGEAEGGTPDGSVEEEGERRDELSAAAEQARIDQLVAYVTDEARSRHWREPYVVTLVIWERTGEFRYTVPWCQSAGWPLELISGDGEPWPPADDDGRERR